MKNIVISGSAKLQKQIKKWINFYEEKNYTVLDYPKKIEETKFKELYPKVHIEFFKNMINTDVLFIMNEDKDNKVGYIGAETFAELVFGISQNLIYNKNIKIVILKMPSSEITCYEEIKLWLELGWIELYEEKKV